ncbi:hypothetical protein ACH42_17105 [Endozoicomonas sp. (ex Bugula neritina AB1)]|nr:hypothetical protein ACH42_17105 [Endozoicomonas sp. (ex Bugula neritina AB1)]
MDNTDAIADFLTHQGNIRALLRNLTAMNEDHMGLHPNEVTCASVGTIASIKQDLEILCEKAGLDVDEILDNE